MRKRRQGVQVAPWRSSAVTGVGRAEGGRETWSLGKAVRTLWSLPRMPSGSMEEKVGVSGERKGHQLLETTPRDV